MSLVIYRSISSFLGGITATLVYRAFALAVEAARSEATAERERTVLVERLFGGFPSLSWSAGVAHLLFNYTIETLPLSGNVRASTALASALGESTDGWLSTGQRTDFFAGLPDLSGNVIAIGSPVSTSATRRLLGYRGRRHHLVQVPGQMNLPLSYVMDVDALPSPGLRARRFVGGQEREMPNWCICAEGRVLPPPKLDRHGWITTDYLVVTRIPNTLSRKALASGCEVLIVAGSHGPGTEAIALLLQDVPKLRVIDKGRRGAAYFQALIPVEGVVHDIYGQAGPESRPMVLGEPQVWPIEHDLVGFSRKAERRRR